jgi:glutamyl-tRNA reductase
MRLFVAGLSFKTAPVEVRERLVAHAAAMQCRGCRVKVAGNLVEAVIVATCNRVEIYGVTSEHAPDAGRLLREFAHLNIDVAPYLYFKQDADAVKHLFSVASGLDSLVIGETEITGQVKQAYQNAQTARLTGKITNRLFQTALKVAKEVRSRTAVGRGATSVGSVAVELAEKIFDGDFTDRTVLIIGAGKMGEACVRHLAKKGARSVLVANRSYDRAVKLAATIGGTPVSFEERVAALAQADIVVSSTGAQEAIITREDVASVLNRRSGRPLFLIDIAVPRDIEPAVEQLDQVFLYNVDHLETIVRQNVAHRQQELAGCQAIIDRRTTELWSRFELLRTTDRPTWREPEWALAAAMVYQS